MYKRTKQALINSTPPLYTCMFEAQFGRAEYSDIAFAITTRIDSAGCFGVIEYKDMNKEEPIVLGWTRDDKGKVTNRHAVDIANCVTKEKASNTQNYVAEPLRIPQATKQGYIEVQEGGVFDGSYPTSTTRRGRVQEGGEVSPTLLTSGDNINRYEGMQVEQIDDKIVETTYRIRKLTPRECFRLMGVDDKDIDTIQASGVSNSQQYKMAGNSIVVDCLYHLFRKMFTETQSEDRQLTLF